MELYLTFGRWDIFLLVLARVAAVIGVAPVFGTRSIPNQVKVGLAVVLTVLLVPMQTGEATVLSDWISMMLAVTGEVLVGLLMGFAGVLVFSAVQIASRVVGIQIGLGMPSTMDPFWTESGSFLDTFYGMMAIIIFLGIGGHHIIITALARSFELVPLATYGLKAVTGDHLLALSAAAFNTAIQLSIAAVGTMLLADIAMGLVVRTMPQLNIFSVGMSVKTSLGLLILALLAPWTIVGFSDLGRGVAQGMAVVLR